jgi:UDP-glucose 4-epimerase
MNILVTGDRGFIGGYLVQELLNAGHNVVGVDNNSKYGNVKRSFDNHWRYLSLFGDCTDPLTIETILKRYNIDQVVAGAALIGGISYFHKYHYQIISHNERIIASTYDAVISHSVATGKKLKVNVISSSMVYESVKVFPTPEGAELTSPPPISSYGFQKLATEYFARAAFKEFEIPYTIIRPFNCVGVGESKSNFGPSANSRNSSKALLMSHVIPDIIVKILNKQDPLRLLGDGEQVRCYTYGGDIAVGIRKCIEKLEAVNQDFNISTNESLNVNQLAQIIWSKMVPRKKLKLEYDKPFEHDVQYRVPDTTKAKTILGFEAKTSLSDALDEVIPWVKREFMEGRI